VIHEAHQGLAWKASQAQQLYERSITMTDGANPTPGQVPPHKVATHDHMLFDGTIVEENTDEVLSAMSATDPGANPYGLCAAATIMGFAAQAVAAVLSNPELAERVETADDPGIEIALILLQEGERVVEEITKAEADRVAGLTLGN
jgi:hypothetical protein